MTRGQQVDQRMGQRVGLAPFAGRDEREGDVAEEVGQAFLVDVARIVPGAAVPDAGLTRGNLGPPLVGRHADVVLLGDARGHRIDEPLVEPGHRRLVEDQLAVFLHDAAEAGVELPVVGAVGVARIEAVAGFDQAGVLHLLGVLDHVGEGVFAGLDFRRQRLDLLIGVADRLHVRLPEEEGPRLRILRNAVDDAPIGGDLDQVRIDVVERPGVEVDVVLDRHDQARLRPRRDVLVAGGDDVGRSAGFGAEGQGLLEIIPGVVGGLLDGDVEFLAADRCLALEQVGRDVEGIDAVHVVGAGAARPDADGHVLGEDAYGSGGEDRSYRRCAQQCR